MRCWWTDNNPSFTDEKFPRAEIERLLDVHKTYTVHQVGDKVVGIAPVTTLPIINRRIIMTRRGADPFWNIVDIAKSAAETYDFQQEVDHLVCYELDSKLVKYLNNDEESNETSLPRTTRMELLGALDEMLGERQAYWSFWEAEEPDDVVEIYGGLPNNKYDLNTADMVVELYSEPRVVKEAAARGLKASLSEDLKTGYDLLSKETKNNVRAEVRRRRPRLLVTSPPCTKFSQLQNLRPYPERLQEELPEAIDHMTFSVEMQEEQLARGDHGLHEHPDTATSWMLPAVEK